MNDQRDTTISFIIPTFNEEKHLPRLIVAIKDHMVDLNYEIIVVDNGSSDSTVRIGREHDVMIKEDNSLTIGGLRNLGARYAKGGILVFFDADMYIMRAWADEIRNTVENLRRNAYEITGSRASISEEKSWIERVWFSPMSLDRNPNYMNSGHLIIRKDVFDEIGGFDETFTTGEDYEFCTRAKKKGVTIVNNPKLYVIHDGYPRSLKSFILREKWHGSRDVSNLSSFWESVPAKLAALFWSSYLLGVMVSVYNWSIFYFVTACVFSSTICMLAALKRRRQFPLRIWSCFLLFHAYFFARGLALKDRFFSQCADLQHRTNRRCIR